MCVEERETSTTRKKCFNGGYLAEDNITLEINLTNGGFCNIY